MRKKQKLQPETLEAVYTYMHTGVLAKQKGITLMALAIRRKCV